MGHPPLQPELSASPQFNLKSSHVKGVKTVLSLVPGVETKTQSGTFNLHKE